MSELSQNERDYPRFATKLEEDAYWAGEHAKIEARALAAFANGTVTRGRAARQIAELREKRAAKSAEEPVQLDPVDAQKASELAVRRGVEFQELVRTLVHDALERELSPEQTKSRFDPASVQGEPVSTTVLRDRG